MARKNQIVPAAAPDADTGIVKWEDEIAAEAKDLAAKFTVSSQKISFQGGDISIGGVAQANPLPVLIADCCFENALYEGDYDPDNPTSPVCYARGRDEATMKPDPHSTKPQADSCKVCPLNQFGSSGKGKACKNQVKLMCLSASVDADSMATAEVLPAMIPPTSLSNWGMYVKGLRDLKLVPWATITEIKSEKFKTWFKITFRPVGAISKDLWMALKSRKASIEEMMYQPYAEPKEAEAKPAAKGRRKF